MNEKSEGKMKQIKVKATAHNRLKVLAARKQIKMEILATEAVFQYLKNPTFPDGLGN